MRSPNWRAERSSASASRYGTLRFFAGTQRFGLLRAQPGHLRRRTAVGRSVSRIRLGQPGWPATDEWQRLSRAVGGRLLSVRSPLTACANGADATACESLFRELKNPYYIGVAEDTKPAFPRDSPQFQIAPEIAALPSEAIVDKITMSAFAGTYLDIAFRDSGINSLVICGIALEVGIEPTVRHATDLGYIPIVVMDACGFGDVAAAERTRSGLAFGGETLQADVDTIGALFRRFKTDLSFVSGSGLGRT